jgi:uncharacterized protein (DUF983 family)
MASRLPDPGPAAGDGTAWADRSTPGERFRRGVTGACPRCGGRDVSDGFLTLKNECGDCRWMFEREEGYWLGSMGILIVVVLLFFAVFLAVGIIGFWPDVAWTALTYGGFALNLLVPIVLYRWSKMAWLGLHTAFAPAELAQDHASRTGV